MYADLSCPFSYVVHAHWRQLRQHYVRQIEIRHKSLALEYVNSAPTPKTTLEAELPILLNDEPGIPCAPWSAPASEWPVTIWPAFEAVKCAELQGVALASEMAWAIRKAFFSGSRCISMRHVLLDLAGRAGLEAERFEADLDSGVCKPRVIAEAREGWERLRVPGSPTWVLPDGSFVSDFGLPEIDVDDQGRATLHGKPGDPAAQRTARMGTILDGLL
ncbi:dithiol-disulfide isomerase [soil metagenome]